MNLLEFKSYTKLYIKGISTAWKIDMQYRTNFIVSILGLCLSLFGAILFIEVLYLNVDEILGWDKYDLWMLYGLAGLNIEIQKLFFYDSRKISGKIKDGYLDKYLLLPKKTLFGLLFINPFVFSVPDVVVNGLIIAFAYLNGSYISPFILVSTIILAQVFIFSLTLFFQTLNFYTHFPHTAGYLSNEIIGFGKTPYTFLNSGVQIAFSLVFPIFITGGIAFMLQNNTIPKVLLLNISVIVFAMLFLNIKFWKHGLKSYSSASS